MGRGDIKQRGTLLASLAWALRADPRLASTGAAWPRPLGRARGGTYRRGRHRLHRPGVDVSKPVDDARYKLQMEGIAQALEDPSVIRAIVGGAKGGILFSMITWADQSKVNVPWTHITNEQEAKAAAMRVRALPRQGGEFTCMSRMMRFVSDKIVPQIPAKAAKVVLDVSGDGRDNCNEPEPVEQVRGADRQLRRHGERPAYPRRQ